MNLDLKTTVSAYEDQLVHDLIQLINIPSVSGDATAVGQALAWVLQRAAELGFRTSCLLGGKVGLIEAGPEAADCETLGILAHVDVVPPGAPAHWASPPFSAELRDGAVWGRGALDDKGPVLASLYALKAVTELGVPLKKRVQIILGTQEETEWSDIWEYCARYPLPDYGFTPDGEFPLCNIEKGSADVLVTIPLDQGPWEKRAIVGISGGTASNIIPDHCTALLEEPQPAHTAFPDQAPRAPADTPPNQIEGKKQAAFVNSITLQATGRAAHSCQPEKGENAIFNMCRSLLQQDLADNTLHKAAALLLSCCEDIYGSGLGLYSPTEYYNGEFVHRNTLSPTLIYTAENQLTVSFNVRFPYGVEKQELLDAFSQFAARLKGTAEIAAWLPAVYIPRDKPFMMAFNKAYKTVTGRPDELALAFGGSYAKAMPNIASWGPLFPGEADTCHESNENITVKSLMSNTEIFAEALRLIVLSDESFK